MSSFGSTRGALLCGLWLLSAPIWGARPLRICVNQYVYPPYVFYLRPAPTTPLDKVPVVGLSVDLFDRLLGTKPLPALPPSAFKPEVEDKAQLKTKHKASEESLDELAAEGNEESKDNEEREEKPPVVIKREYRYLLMPWKECLFSSLIGDTVQAAVSDRIRPAYANTYRISQPLFTSEVDYWYSKEKHPKGIILKKADDKSKYKVCGVRYHDYTRFGFKAEDIGRKFSNYAALFSNLAKGKCDIAFAEREVVLGYRFFGKDYIAQYQLMHAKAAWIKPTHLYLLISRQARGATRWLRRIDSGLQRLKKSGEYRKLITHYVPERKPVDKKGKKAKTKNKKQKQNEKE